MAGEEGAYEELISIANSPADQYTKIGAWDKLTNPNDPQRYLQAEDLAKKICGAKYRVVFLKFDLRSYSGH